MKLKLFAVLLALSFAAIPSHAQTINGISTGNDLQNVCSYLNPDSSTSISDPTTVGVKMGQCEGFIEATLQTMEFYAALDHTTLPIPTTITVGQAITIVRKYLADHPERWNQPAAELVFMAFANAFPRSKQ